MTDEDKMPNKNSIQADPQTVQCVFMLMSILKLYLCQSNYKELIPMNKATYSTMFTFKIHFTAFHDVYQIYVIADYSEHINSYT